MEGVAFDPVRGDSHIGGYVAFDYFALDDIVFGTVCLVFGMGVYLV